MIIFPFQYFLYRIVHRYLSLISARSVIGIQDLELESVKINSDSFRFWLRFLPTYIEGRIIAFRFKSVSNAPLF